MKKSLKENKKVKGKKVGKDFDAEYLLLMSEDDRLAALGKEVKKEKEVEEDESSSKFSVLLLAVIAVFFVFLLEGVGQRGIVDKLVFEMMFMFLLAISLVVGLIFLLFKLISKK